MHDRSLEFTRQLDQFRVSAGATGGAQDCDLFRVVQNLGQQPDLFVGRTNGCPLLAKTNPRLPFPGLQEGNVSGNGDNFVSSYLREFILVSLAD